MLETIGYGPTEAAAFAPWAAADAAVGRVLCRDAGVVAVLSETGVVRVGLGGRLLEQVARDPGRGPCAGDWVVLREWPGRRVTLEAVLARRTTLSRRAPRGEPVCANVDLLAVLAPTHGDGRIGLDRLAGAVRGVQVVACGQRPDDVGRLRERIHGGSTVALAGPGPGRAAMVRAIVGADVLPAAGRAPVLVPVPGGGALVDVPGLPEAAAGRRARPGGG